MSLFVAIGRADETPPTGRLTMNLDAGWEFRYPGDDAAADPPWRAVALPHTWTGADLWDDEPGYLRGVGVYRRKLQIPADRAGRRLYLRFEGVNQVAEVEVNAKPVGRHVGGYTAFTIDITDAVRIDGDNEVVVRVDNRHDPDIPPLSADFNFYGGIYRDVWLVVTNPTHFTMSDHGSDGVFVETPSVSAESATVRVRGTVEATSGSAKALAVRATIHDPDGRLVASAEGPVREGPERTFDLTAPPIDRPVLWSPQNPNLYRVVCTLLSDGKAVDELELPLGFRWFTFDAQKGFSLNGAPLRLVGVNRHQDRAGVACAMTDAMHVEDLEIIKAMGANFLRLAHYPQDPAVLEAADRLGLIVWEEIPIVNYVTPSEAFRATCRTMLVEMIRQHRNHPSVLMWGYMNEVFLFEEGGKRMGHPGREEYTAWTVQLARELDELARREDPSRVTVMAGQGGEIYNTSGLADVPMVFGWNIYYGWYHGEFDGFGKFLDDQHTRYPHRPLIVSEYGAGTDSRLHSTNPRRFDFTTEWGERFHESHLAQILERPRLCGSAVWNQFDFAVESRGDSIPHLNQKGLCTYDRRPKDVYYLYQARLAQRPVLHIATTEWTHRTAWTDAALRPVKVYSNCGRVELFHNGASLGEKVPKDGFAEWPVEFADGENQLVARGVRGDRPVEAKASVQFERLDWTNFAELRVNAGADVEYRSAAPSHQPSVRDAAWLPDRAYAPGAWGAVGGTNRPESSGPNVRGTDDDPLYQSYLEGLEAYRFDCPDGEYELDLHFAEMSAKAPGERVFRVTVNGTEVIRDLDLFATAGRCRAQSVSLPVTARGGEGIRVEFSARVGKTLLNGIRLARRPGAPAR